MVKKPDRGGCCDIRIRLGSCTLCDVLWPCQDLGTGSGAAGSGSEGKEAGRAIAMETMWLAYS